jgi:alanine-synthesizing transaminase
VSRSDPDRVLITSGTSEGIEPALTAIVDEGEEVLGPSPTYPLYTAVLAKIGATPVYYRTDHTNGWLPDLDDIRRVITPKTRALVVIDPNNPTGAIYPDEVRRALIEIANSHGLVIPADEVDGDMAYDGALLPPMALLDQDAPIISYSSLLQGLPRARLARRLDGRGPLTPPRWCCWPPSRSWPTAGSAAPGPMQDAVIAALNGDRIPPGDTFRRELRMRAELTTSASQSDSRHVVCRSPRRVLRHAEDDAAPGTTDRDYVLALLRATGILVVYGSGLRRTARGWLLPRRVPRLDAGTR